MWTGCDVCVVCVVRVGGLTVVMSGRSRTAIDVRIPTIPGRGTGFHRRGRQWLHEAASAVLFFGGGAIVWAAANGYRLPQNFGVAQMKIYCTNFTICGARVSMTIQ